MAVADSKARASTGVTAETLRAGNPITLLQAEALAVAARTARATGMLRCGAVARVGAHHPADREASAETVTGARALAVAERMRRT